MLSGMITAPAVAQGPGRVTVEEVLVQDLMVIRADIMVKIVIIPEIIRILELLHNKAILPKVVCWRLLRPMSWTGLA